MTERLSVFGLGYVGCVSAACLSHDGHDTIGVDVNPAKVAMITAGASTILEEGLDERVSDAVRAGRLRATTDAAEAVAGSDISLVCVGTPSRANGSFDASLVERVCVQIGLALADKTSYHIVVIRSTVLPGTIEELVIPLLERESGKRAGTDFGVCANPEFLREGSSVRDFYYPPLTLVGSSDPAAAQRVAALYADVAAPTCIVPLRTAEMVKYACNCFHGVKVSFANEIGNLCKALGIDSHEVMRIVCADTKLNLSAAYLRPGFAFGGSCLPKDLRAITYRARQVDVDTPLLRAALETNQRQIQRAVDMVLDAGHRRVGILGLSFKEGTDDLRESPMVAVVEALIGKGLHVRIYDRNVRQGGLLGTNREFLETRIPHIWSLMCGDLDDVVAGGDTIVLGNQSEEFRRVLLRPRPEQLVIDLVRVFEDQVSGNGYHGICW